MLKKNTKVGNSFSRRVLARHGKFGGTVYRASRLEGKARNVGIKPIRKKSK
ncbi:hypothetical protein KJ751_02100 [Patescibacteria group bacterium]|nr:hypothetical protein [Patescibacteria group bacterium]